MSLAYDDIAHSKHTEDHPCSEEFCLPKCQHSQERQGAQRAEAPNVVLMSTSSAERAARRISRRIVEIMRSRGLVFTSYRGQWDDVLKEDEIAAIIREEVTQNVCGLNCSCHEDGELCHQCCMVPARSSGEPKGEGKSK